MIGNNKDLRTKIAEHMGKDPSSFAILTELFESYNHPNLHLALESYISTEGRSAKVLGIQGGALNFGGTSMTDIMSRKSVVNMVGFGGAKEGPVQYTNIPCGKEQNIACVEGALYLISSTERLSVLLRKNGAFGQDSGMALDVLAEDKAAAETFVNHIRYSINKNNIYRGKILSVAIGETAEGIGKKTGLVFHEMEPVEHHQIVLPAGLLDRIERQTIEAGKFSDALKRAKRKLKRGILLHGKPGTGKTLTAMYLASAMTDRTVLLVTGRGQGTIQTSCKLARWLAPSMIVIEDVDLIAEDRSLQNSCTLPLLFELLNEMDGLENDCDVLFVLTTNKPELLEPALASRPGRVDQAFEVPLPDAECRRKLFELYSDGLILELNDLDNIIERTAGASGAFIAELLRKAALFAAPDGEPLTVKEKHLDEALHELLFMGGALTKSLLGFEEPSHKPQ